MRETDYVTCNLCGLDNSRIIYRVNDSNVVKCRKCGLMYINPRPKPEIFEEVYNTQYFENQNFYKSDKFLYGYKEYISEEEDIRVSFRRIFEKLQRYGIEKGRLLEIGCAMGFFLDAARENGWQVHGVEISKRAVEYATEKLGLQVLNRSLKDSDFPKEFFKAVVLLDVIEHLGNPLLELYKYHRLLKPGGILVLSTINVDSLIARLLGKRWEDLRRTEEHLFIFSKKTMVDMLKKARFEPIHIEQYGRYFSIDSICKRWEVYSESLVKALLFLARITRLGHKRIYVRPLTKIIIYARRAG